MSYTINLLWDSEASVWVAIPDLLKLNCQPLSHVKVVIEI